MATIEVPQGTSQSAAGSDDFKFPYMDSCLGIICYLSAGRKCAAHMVSTDEDGEAAQMLGLKNKISAEGAKASVSRIILIGNTDAWGEREGRIESIFTLAQRSPANPDADLQKYMQSMVRDQSILWHEDRAKRALSLYYKCPEDKISVIPQKKSPADLHEAAGKISEVASVPR